VEDNRIEFKCKVCNAFFELYAENLYKGKAKLVCPNCGAKPPDDIRKKFLSDFKKFVKTKRQMTSSMMPVLDTFMIHSRYLDHTPETIDDEEVILRRLAKVE